MARRMTLCILPQSKDIGVMDHGEVAPAEVIAMAKRWAADAKERAEEVLAAADDEFRVTVVDGVHVQHPVRTLQEGRAQTPSGSSQ